MDFPLQTLFRAHVRRKTLYVLKACKVDTSSYPNAPVLASLSAPGSEMGVSIQEEAKGEGGGGRGGGLLAKPSPLLPECGTAAFQNPAAPAHSSWRAKKKKWLFIRILVWYCSAPHKRRFIMLEAERETISWNCLFLECIINVISSRL